MLPVTFFRKWGETLAVAGELGSYTQSIGILHSNNNNNIIITAAHID